MFSGGMPCMSGLWRMPACGHGGIVNPSLITYFLDMGLREPSAGHLGMGPLLPPVATGGTLPSSTVGWWLLGMRPLCPPPQFSGPVSPLPMCDLRDTESYGPVSAQDKNNGHCLLSASISVPGTLPGTCYLNVII